MSVLLAALQAEFRDWALSWEDRGARLTSFLRRPRFVGDESQHQLGLAVDFGLDSPVDAISEDAKARGYLPLLEPDHLHVQRFRAGFLRACGLV